VVRQLSPAGAGYFALTLNPSKTQVFVSTTTALYSIIIFICGALFSAGLSMLLNLIRPEKK
jgi:hypothetical protein